MTAPVAKTDIVATTLNNILSQFHGTVVMNAIVSSWAVQLQELEFVFWQLQVLRTVDYATGIQLDLLGALVGERRDGRPDEEFRVAIKARVRSNVSYATVEEVLACLQASRPGEYWLQEYGGAFFVLELPDAWMTQTLAVGALAQLLHRVKGGGVRAEILWHDYDLDNVFTLSEDDDQQASTTQGLADDAETTGGHLADYY